MSDALLSFRTAVGESSYRDTRWDATSTRSAVGPIRSPSADIDLRRRRQFAGLVSQWSRDTTLLSSVSDMIAHPAYRAIVAMGPPAISLILDQMERDPDFWFEALREITGQDPVSQEDVGNLPRMTQAWLDWGAQHDYR